MAENEDINSTLEIIDTEVYEQDIRVVDETDQVIVETEMQTIEVFEEDVSVVESDNAFSPIGEPNELLRHTLLTEREADDQHPITAITGLRAELDEIEKLKTVYSDKKNHANYYQWEDGNAAKEDRVGYFVSVCADEIKLCTLESDVFGVTVDSAGFVGAQSDIEKDEKYGLVASNGLVLVRCELSVDVGDYVISNNYGYAQKSDFGFVVVSRQKINGIEYAGIALTTPINRICKLSANIEGLDGRMSDAEKNIISAINASNAAYKKAEEASNTSQNANNNVSSALDKVNGIVEKTDELESNITSAQEVAVQAKAIAESAANSAEAIRNEAVAEANKALAESSELRKEFETRVVEINTELDNTILELEATKEEFDATINDLKLDTEGQIADFKKEVEDNYATITQLAAVKTENADAVAALQQEVSDTYATIESVASLETNTSEALAGFKQEVSKTYATQEMLTAYKNDTSEALTLYKTEVEENYATQEMVSKLEADTTKVIADYKQEVTDTYATQEMVTKLGEDNSTALADYKQEVTETYATQTSLTALETETTKAIAVSEEKATEKFASKSDLTAFEGEINSAIANVEQKADENGASIKSVVASVDKYSVGEYSQAYGLTHEQAKSILKVGMIYIPANNPKETTHVETYEGQGQDNYFTEGRYYEWDGDDWQENTVGKVWISNTVPANSNGTYKYWYVDSNEAPEGYEAHALYKYDGEQWKKVNILDGNVNNRLTSMIKQMADKIAIDVVNAQGNIASHQQWLDSNSANIQDVVAWKSDVENDVSNIATIKQTADEAGASIAQVVESVGEDGKVNAASIVTAINDGTSGVTINANRINLDGAVTISSFDSDTRDKLNNSVKSTVIEYALSNSATVAPTSGWSTTAPQWQENKYMWQKTTVQYTDSSKTPTITTTCIQGAKGEDGKTPEIEINDNGYWVIDGTTTNTKAKGVDGETPTVMINTDGYWVINGVVTNVKAQGKEGDNGVSVTSVMSQYCLSTSNTIEPTNGWTENFDTVLSQYWASTETVKYIWSREKVSYSSGNPTYSTATVNSASSVVASWCDKNDTTKINGGNIATNTVTADQIYVQDLSALKSTIGGWKIDANGIHSNTSSYVVDLWAPSEDPNNTAQWIFMFTDNTGAQPTYPFVVRKDGTLLAERANIGGWGINSGTSGLIKKNDDFEVCIKAPTEYGGYGKGSADFIVLADKTGDVVDYPFVVSSDGSLFATKARITGDSVIEGNCTIKGRLDGATGNFTGHITARGGNIGNLKIDADNSCLSYFPGGQDRTFMGVGGFEFIRDGKGWFQAIMTNLTIGNDPVFFINMSSGGHGLQLDPSGGRLLGTWSTDNGKITCSDQNLKHSIEPLTTNYSTLFDSLNPVRFKYNNGTSDRYHTGFVAQELQQAIIDAGLSEQEVATLCTIKSNNDEDDYMGIRYEELIALCVNEIQKLKIRVQELENKEN